LPKVVNGILQLVRGNPGCVDVIKVQRFENPGSHVVGFSPAEYRQPIVVKREEKYGHHPYRLHAGDEGMRGNLLGLMVAIKIETPCHLDGFVMSLL